MKSKTKNIWLILAGIVVLTGSILIAQPSNPASAPSPTDRGTLANGGKILPSRHSRRIIPRIAELQVMSFEIVRVSNESPIGDPGDFILVIHGQGFLVSESSPIVHLGSKVSLEETYVNQDMTSLYAVLPKVIAKELERDRFTEFHVQNPGGLNRPPQRWFAFSVDPGNWKEALKTARMAVFRRGINFVELAR